ncbi:MAG: molybdopterin-dependent oxidoreductase [Proteobacteria bacterium]|nr:molybdopterin-dependent oxidoreductase [Pseudomonadota bacterium]
MDGTDAASTRQAAIRTTCPYCGVGCGILAAPDRQDGATIVGDPDHPANRGRLCSKGAALGETLSLDGRLLHPEMHGRRTDWHTALQAVADGFQRIVATHGPDAVAFYVSGQLLTEDYYVANKLIKGFIGTANIDTNSRLCMASSVAGHRRAFGSDTVPGTYEDLEQADLIVLVGANLAWCHPVLYQRIAAAKAQRPGLRVVVVDPRSTATCDTADLHLPLRPGSDVLLFNGVLAALARDGRVDRAFVAVATENFEAALSAAVVTAGDVAAVAAGCDLDTGDVARFFALFAATERVVTVYSQGVNQSSCGTDKVNAIINCHLATGRIGRPGMGPFSVTGQPNAMGGREVGALANQLAAHMDFDRPDDVDRVGRFWRAPHIATRPGLKAVDLFHAVEAGRIRALWIMATNPVVSMPEADQVRRALHRCDLVVVSDCMRTTDTAGLAHILLPALAWGEKDGTVTNSERCISRQRSFLSAPGEARPDWWMLAETAKRLGFGEAFAYRSPADIFREHAALSAFENDGRRDFDLGGLATIDDAAFDALAPVMWPVPVDPAGARARFFADGRFYTANHRGRFVPVRPRPPANAPDGQFPLALNTGRTRDQWHTMTRTGKSPRLSLHAPEPLLDIHPADAAAGGLADGALARLRSRWGEALARVRLSPEQRRGVAFMPMHWNDQFAGAARVNAVINPVVDPISGQPEFKHTPIRVTPFAARWYGFALARRRPELDGIGYWVASLSDGFWRHDLAGEEPPADAWRTLRAALHRAGAGEWAQYRDATIGRYRGALVCRGRLEACLFVGPTPNLPPIDWLAGLFRAKSLSDEQRAALLAGQSGVGTVAAGPVVCACFGVGRLTIRAAITQHGLTTTAAVGAALQAGTNCGSCLPEIRALLAAVPAEAAD